MARATVARLLLVGDEVCRACCDMCRVLRCVGPSLVANGRRRWKRPARRRVSRPSTTTTTTTTVVGCCWLVLRAIGPVASNIELLAHQSYFGFRLGALEACLSPLAEALACRFHFRKLFPPGILRPPHCLRSPEETKQLFANALSRGTKGVRIATTQTSLHKCASSARRTTPR